MSESTLKPEILKKYKGRRKVFVETGTSRGEGVAVALECGFEIVYSIEANEDVFAKACERFAMMDNVVLLHGDSGEIMASLLRGLKERAVFWLDSHWSTGEPELAPGMSKCPVLLDLQAIREHPVKDHVILIDDIRYFRGPGIAQWGNVTLSDILEMIMDVNPNYWTTFEAGFCPNDILVARVNGGEK